MKRRLFSILLTSALILSSSVQAAGWTSAGMVDYVHPWGAGFTIHIVGVTHDCGSTGHQFFVPWSEGGVADKLYALALTAFSSGKKVAVNYICNEAGDGVTSDMDIR